MRILILLLISTGFTGLLAESPLQNKVNLEFRQLTHEGDPDGIEIKSSEKDVKTIWVKKKVLMNESSIRSAKLELDENAQINILVEYTEAGSKKFTKITEDLTGKRLAIIINNVCVSSPHIREPIAGGRAQISGQFTKEEAQKLVNGLNGKK